LEEVLAEFLWSEAKYVKSVEFGPAVQTDKARIAESMNGSDWRLILKGKAHDSFRRGSILD
jgi:hypothetical protein